MSITFKQLEHTYSPNTPFSFAALKGVNLSIEKGTFTAIIGHTGSGKSTLIQHLNALLLPTSGSLSIDDIYISQEEKPQSLKPLRQKVGLVFQFPEYQLFEESIEKDIMFGPINFGISEDEAKERTKKALKQVGLDESYLEKSPFDLSGGQKRRVAIAGILVMQPDILVLDEPTAGLDPQGAKEMMHLFKQLHKNGTTIILVTHDMNHVLNYCDHAVVMNKGTILKSGTVHDIFKEVDILSNLSIELPLITSFIHSLNEQGFNLRLDITTMEELVDEIGGALS